MKLTKAVPLRKHATVEMHLARRSVSEHPLPTPKKKKGSGKKIFLLWLHKSR